ncbi:MAG: pnp [Candidatus Saganbacteria bacterium]|uniref:Polyribonucleotide nucleotidyltransferase n=1 Tax=Candidatus Saganbacteria bacterium TaxID=2575572 RepID=A0A833NYU6_UNCSA|nr:MAG: pnp [Candidatus Saganbacteria bacterium]
MIQKIELPFSDGRIISIETGRVAKKAGGSVIVRLGDTMVLAAATASASPREGINFFPLTVDFEEKLYAIGRIPGGFFRREGKPSEKSILTGRKVDRTIRPLFPEGYFHDVQVIVTPLSVDQDNPPDVLAIVAASAALSISDIPFDGPIAGVRVCRINGAFVINPTNAQIKESDLDLVAAGTKDKILMLEAGCKEISEKDIFEAIKSGHAVIKDLIKLQEDLVSKAGKPKANPVFYKANDEIKKFVYQNAEKKIQEAMRIADKEKQNSQLNSIQGELKKKAEAEPKIAELFIKKPFDYKNVIEEIEYDAMRKMVLQEGKRIDGRGFKQIREIKCELGVLPRTHGSAIFSRGDTQVLTVATLGSPGEEQRLEGLDVEETGKKFMHHYNFPSYSVGETRPSRGPGRREIGHGALAEKAVQPVLPNEEKFPYTLRLVSEVLSSNGSTSMASTCGSTLALMDAGVKISSPVAGISVGLVTGEGKNITITDIQGLEDHLGDMDFKVAGTREGITAVQVDVKIRGLSYEVVEQALSQAKEGRFFILDKMEDAIKAPREEMSKYAPRIISFDINPEKIGMVIGPGGKNIKAIIEETGVQIDIEDSGKVLITTADAEAGKLARKKIEDITFEPKIGDVFSSRIVRITNFGAFAELPGGKDGLIHVSQISQNRVNKVEDVLSVGDEVVVKVVEIDDMGRINITLKGVTEEDKKRIIS